MKKISYIFLSLLISTFSPIISQGAEKTMKKEKAIFAGGCFWCIEAAFDNYKGVYSAQSGYIGGSKEDADYKKVSMGNTGHIEAVMVEYDPDKVSYNELLDFFWMQIDPTDQKGQFVDRGSQYVTGIFYLNETQKKEAEASKEKLQASGVFDKPIVTPIVKATPFYLAEDYHQDYHLKSKFSYKMYRFRSGRDQFLKKIWSKVKGQKFKNKEMASSNDPQSESFIQKMRARFKKPTLEAIKEKLTPLQFKVTRKAATEPAFKNEYWNNKKAGIYVDVATGEPLFSSLDKFQSGTGWPSFSKPLHKELVLEKDDYSLFQKRTEVKSLIGDSHLGHVFNDNPKSSTGLRYCINSAALRFVPLEELKKQGYEDYLKLFEKNK